MVYMGKKYCSAYVEVMIKQQTVNLVISISHAEQIFYT